MSSRAADYEPRAAEHAVVYRVIDEHLEAFLETARRHADGSSLPEFVEQEFRDFLACGVLAHGFACLQCTDCAFERLVPFSCKGRGVCPSCGGRRMTERAARLVDEVLPRVPVRAVGAQSPAPSSLPPGAAYDAAYVALAEFLRCGS